MKNETAITFVLCLASACFGGGVGMYFGSNMKDKEWRTLLVRRGMATWENDESGFARFSLNSPGYRSTP